MKFSVVTVSLDQAAFLEACLQSVAAAARDREVEHIVMDGGSTDGSVEILERHHEELAFWTSRPDDGPAAAINAGFERATGDVYACLNADDCYLPGAVDRARAAFEREPGTDVVYGHGIMVDAEGRGICRIFSDRWDLERALYGRCVVVQQGTFYRAEAFERAGGFNEANRTCWDAELLVDLATAGAKFRRIDEAMGAFRIHRASITGSGRLEAAYRDDRRRIREKVVGDEPRAVVWGKTKWHGMRRILAEPRLAAARARERVRTLVNV